MHQIHSLITETPILEDCATMLLTFPGASHTQQTLNVVYDRGLIGVAQEAMADAVVELFQANGGSPVDDRRVMHAAARAWVNVAYPGRSTSRQERMAELIASEGPLFGALKPVLVGAVA